MLLQLALSVAMLLLCAGAVAVLALVLTWQERAASPNVRRRRLWQLVLPVGGVLLCLLLGALTLLLLLWVPGGAEVLKDRSIYGQFQ